MGGDIGNAIGNYTGVGQILGFGNGGGLLGDITGSNATNQAISSLQNGANQATATMGTVYGQQTQALQPYEQAGLSGLKAMQDPSLTAAFNPGDLSQTPGYQFQLQQGQNAINNAAAARGLGNSGSTMKALDAYSQNLADTTYQQALNNYNTNRQINYNMAQGVTNAGLSATNQQVNAGTAYSNGLAGIQTGLANSQAAAQINHGNQVGNLIGQGVSTVGAIFSDQRLKKDIREATKEEIDEMRKYVKAYFYKYTSDQYGKGDWVGVMAQDLEKSKIGRLLVIENEHGNKTIDLKKVLSMYLATMEAA